MIVNIVVRIQDTKDVIPWTSVCLSNCWNTSQAQFRQSLRKPFSVRNTNSKSRFQYLNFKLCQLTENKFDSTEQNSTISYSGQFQNSYKKNFLVSLKQEVG